MKRILLGGKGGGGFTFYADCHETETGGESSVVQSAKSAQSQRFPETYEWLDVLPVAHIFVSLSTELKITFDPI